MVLQHQNQMLPNVLKGVYFMVKLNKNRFGGHFSVHAERFGQFLPPTKLATGASTTLSLYVLPPVLSAYLRQYPTIQISALNQNSTNIQKALLEHDIDVGIIESLTRLNTLTYSPFTTDEVLAVCSATSPLRTRTLTVADLPTVPLALRENGSGTLPDVIVYPTGGGTGLIGIWKAFHELKRFGWLTPHQPLPRMVAVQAGQCCPIVDTFWGKQPNCKQYVGKPTLANGLAVPRPIGEPLMLSVLRESGGTALAISEDEMVDGVRELCRQEGIFAAPEGGAIWSATQTLLRQGWIRPDDHVLLLNTGSGQSYLDNLKGKW